MHKSISCTYPDPDLTSRVKRNCLIYWNEVYLFVKLQSFNNVQLKFGRAHWCLWKLDQSLRVSAQSPFNLKLWSSLQFPWSWFLTKWPTTESDWFLKLVNIAFTRKTDRHWVEILVCNYFESLSCNRNMTDRFEIRIEKGWNWKEKLERKIG